jgi:hypothetical protein
MAKKDIVTTREVIKVHVKFTLNTPDGLRRVTFELEKDTTGEDDVQWKITFKLFERGKKSDPFDDPLVELLVEVDSRLNAKAQAVADNGMTPNQAAFALGPAADMAADPMVSDAKKKATVQNTLKK